MSEAMLHLGLVGWADAAMARLETITRLRRACVTTIIDADGRRGRSAADAVGATFVVGSLEAALREHGAEFDAVVIRLPLAEREGAIRLAAAAGKHVLAVAPIAATQLAARAIFDYCSSTESRLAIGDTWRFHPSSLVVRGRLTDGTLGAPGLLRVHRWRPRDTTPFRSLAGHVFADVDLAIWLFGELPNSVYAIGRGATGHPEPNATMPENLQVHLGFAAGGMAILDFATALPSGRSYDSVSLIGSNGAAYADDHHNTHLLFRGGHPAALTSEPGELHTLREFQAFVDAILERTPLAAGIADCCKAHRLVDAIAKSLELKQALQAEGASYELIY